MPIFHIVQFGFKPDASAEKIDDICRRMLSLKDNCVHPTAQKPYIKSAIGGRDTSPEGHQGGVTHVFVSEFENEEDRQYYLDKDPAHIEFKNAVKDLVQTVRVVDFEPGKF
ncbi:putative stress responsive a b barrel domain-containing protein [Neofusicoccum parvum UCRNP2]|uniref:Stress-response A/B barrel domain-containing protein n=2 Tax=Neofusicoccum TaxID=407951 RepID=A0ABR3SWL7_9PEZI|nr:putative stress responsive a b barrel domain-containing protein [Neofusicoccum parvum UCRNP2]